uniref:Uncharacterized protein n=1 Tax=Romanomermis culicivorax TaxID=13658 RepID=A0A915I7K1_ROMCU
MASVMLGCAIVSALYLRTEKARIRKALTAEDVFVILSSLVFFCAFFVAVFTQYRARYSLCHLFYRFYLINRHWRVKDYDSSSDFIEKKSPKTKNKKSRRQNMRQYYRPTRIVSDV